MFLFFVLTVTLLSEPAALALTEPEVGANAVVLLETKANKVLLSRNENARVYPASLTKIMTVLLAVEAVEQGSVSLGDAVTASENCAFDLVEDGSSSGITAGEVMTLQDLMYCALVHSANEACNIIAEYIAGNIAAFVDQMNAKAGELGCSGTHFANTHGLPDENHYTTAHDMSLIAQAAASYSLFMEICNTPKYTVPATNVSEARELSNTNALINTDSMYSDTYYYEYARGMKTGYTSDAGYCLVSTAAKDGIELLAVVMGASASEQGGSMFYGNFADSITLYDWAFANFSYRDILKSSDRITDIPVTMGSGTDTVTLRPGSAITALLTNDENLENFDTEIVVFSQQTGEELRAPIEAGEVLGEITVGRDGVTYGTTTLVASAAVELSRAQFIKAQIYDTLHLTGVRIFLWVLFLLLVGYAALVVRYRVLYKRHRQKLAQARAARERVAAEEAIESPPPRKASARDMSVGYFSAEDEGGDRQKPEKTEPAGTGRTKPAFDRDYFEEFFGPKK
jgi:D-alanyl-D-alanine carboxypeptidase (penicillin-binding protein 5/6)